MMTKISLAADAHDDDDDDDDDQHDDQHDDDEENDGDVLMIQGENRLHHPEVGSGSAAPSSRDLGLATSASWRHVCVCFVVTYRLRVRAVVWSK
jgi:hypothetical protein